MNLYKIRLREIILLAILLILITTVFLSCSTVKSIFTNTEFNKSNKPFQTTRNYTQEDIFINKQISNHEDFVSRIIEILNKMDFPVDSCVTVDQVTFLKTAFVFKKKQFPTPKHHYLKISLLVEIPKDKSKTINIKHAVCTTCARCEEWYCNQLPVWALQEEYSVALRIQQLIFDFKNKLSEHVN